MKKKIIFIGILASTFLALTGCGKVTVNANDYLELDVSGYNTAGVVSWSFDSEQLVMDNSEAFGISDTSDLEYLSVVMDVDEYLNGEPDNEENLSNGDVVTFKWNEDGINELEQKYNINIDTEDMVLNVASLEEPEEVDLFEYLNVTFEGFSPNGQLNMNVTGNAPVSVKFNADKYDGLQNGDVITVTVSASDGSDITDYCFKNGYVPKETEKEYQVEGLVSYASSLDEIPDDMKEKMQNQALDSLNAYGASWSSDANGDDVKKWVHLSFWDTISYPLKMASRSPLTMKYIWCIKLPIL